MIASRNLRPLLAGSSQRLICLNVRNYASNALGTTSTASKIPRRQVTVTNDDGRVKWGDLTAGEKAARTTQQTINFSVIIVGVIGTIGVGYLLYTNVFSPDSKTAHMSQAFDEIKASTRCTELLGPANQIWAYGENSWSKWTRNRPIAATVKSDAEGRDHLHMHFYAEGPDGKGIVRLHMIRPTQDSSFEYKTLTLDVPGHPTIYLRNDAVVKNTKSGFKFLGVRWA